MANLAFVLKSEIARLARKELRVSNEALRKAYLAQRSDLAAMKKQVAEMEKQLKRLSRAAASAAPRKAAAPRDVGDADTSGLRFRAAGMAANRKRLGLSAADFGLLVGASSMSVSNWEQGKTKPHGAHLAAIAGLRGVGKKEVAKRLEELKAQS